MKNVKFTIGILFFFMLIVPGYALVVRSGGEVEVAVDEVVDDDLIVFAQTVDINGTVSGDVYAFAQSVAVNGEIGGSLFTGAGTITVAAKKVKTVWAAAGNVSVCGDVEKNVILLGGALLICEDTRIGKDLRAYGGKFTVEGAIDGTIEGSVGSFVMAGRSGQITINADETTIKAGARISGDLIVRSAEQPTIEEGATIIGETTVERPEKRKAEPFFLALAPMVAFFVTFVKIVMFIAKIIVGIILIAFSKTFVRRMMDTLIQKPWHSLGWGFLGLIVIPVAAVILFVILIGYPIAIFGVYVYTALVYLSSIFVGLVIGEKVIQLFKKEGEISLYLSFIVGIIVLYVLGLIPVLGCIIKIFVVLFGAGMLLLGGRNMIKSMKEKKLV